MDFNLSLDDIQSSENVAEFLTSEELQYIGSQVKKGYDIDESSMEEWRELIDKAMAIVKQTMETKNEPFVNASNVKYPLITQAAINFNARMYPEIVRSQKVVVGEVLGYDPDGKKLQQACRVGTYMSESLLDPKSGWENGTDKLLTMLPVVGTCFKKIFYDPISDKVRTEVCNPKHVVVNHNTESLNKARRITHLLVVSTNEILECMRAGLYLELDIKKFEYQPDTDPSEFPEDTDDKDTPVELLEQHCWLDLDGDGYKEPYIVTIHKQSGDVLRIIDRFDKIKLNKAGKVKKIEAKHYFIDYHFIPASDGGFYSTGIGTLLYPLNATINSLINQLLDAGTIANNQSGFIGRGLRLKAGDMRLRLGEWRILDSAAGQDLKSNIVPLPTSQPSQVLFQLLEMLIQVGEKLISVNDTMSGQGQTQNVATSTIATLIKQGMTMYASVTKRYYCSLCAEFELLFDLIGEHVSQKDYMRMLQDPQANIAEDFDKNQVNIRPAADPTMSSAIQRATKMQSVMQIPGIAMPVAAEMLLNDLEYSPPEIKRLLPPKDPNTPPPPEQQKLLAETKLILAEVQKTMIDAKHEVQTSQIEMEKLKLDQENAAVLANESAMRIEQMQQNILHGDTKLQLAAAKLQSQQSIRQLEMNHDLTMKRIDLHVEGAKIKADKQIAEIKADGKDNSNEG